MNHLSDAALSGVIRVDVQDELRSDGERALFHEMKARFQQLQPAVFIDDITLLRFLAADQFSVDKGLARLLQTLQWRKSLGVDGLLQNPPPHVARYENLRVRRFVGIDRSCRPIMMERLGQFVSTAPGMGRPFTAEEWLLLYAWDLERHFVAMRASAGACGKPVRSYTYVADCAGMSWKGTLASVPLIKYLAKGVEVYYPEIAGPIVLFNAPAIAAVLYNRFVKHFLDPVTAAKIELHRGVPRRLIEIADPSVIPKEFGGTSDFVLPPLVPWNMQAPESEGGSNGQHGAAGPGREGAAEDLPDPEPSPPAPPQRRRREARGCFSTGLCFGRRPTAAPPPPPAANEALCPGMPGQENARLLKLRRRSTDGKVVVSGDSQAPGGPAAGLTGGTDFAEQAPGVATSLPLHRSLRDPGRWLLLALLSTLAALLATRWASGILPLLVLAVAGLTMPRASAGRGGGKGHLAWRR